MIFFVITKLFSLMASAFRPFRPGGITAISISIMVQTRFVRSMWCTGELKAGDLVQRYRLAQSGVPSSTIASCSKVSASLIRFAQALATPAATSVLPGICAQPAASTSFVPRSLSLQVRPVVPRRQELFENCVAQIGASAATTAFSLRVFAVSSALPPVTQPPQPNPTIASATAIQKRRTLRT